MQYNIYRQQIKDDFIGTLFLPQAKGQYPSVIVIPGSDGGIPETIAERIASYGYVVLALGYFGLEGLPQYLENIHLEYFKGSIEWLQNRSQVNQSPAILGYSRGGELALLIGSLFKHLINGIIAYAPSQLICGGFPYPNRPAWLMNNKPILPYLKGLMSQEETLLEVDDLHLACKEGIIPYHKNSKEDPYEIKDLFLARQKHQNVAADIPVEKISCPLLVISGQQDKIWPSSYYANQISDRLNKKGSMIQRKFLDYPYAGHGIIAPYESSIYHPVGKFWCTLGGSAEGNKKANQEAWKETIEFLEYLKKNN